MVGETKITKIWQRKVIVISMIVFCYFFIFIGPTIAFCSLITVVFSNENSNTEEVGVRTFVYSGIFSFLVGPIPLLGYHFYKALGEI